MNFSTGCNVLGTVTAVTAAATAASSRVTAVSCGAGVGPRASVVAGAYTTVASAYPAASSSNRGGRAGGCRSGVALLAEPMPGKRKAEEPVAGVDPPALVAPPTSTAHPAPPAMRHRRGTSA